MKCPDCRRELPEGGGTCPLCGSPRDKASVSPGEKLGQSEIPTQTRTEAVPTSSPTPELRPGSTLGTRYRIVALAGKGGMGEVYRAEDLKLGQTVALKLLPQELGRDATQLSRLLDEVRIARQVSHPNVCRVYDIGEAEGRHFLSMEWIEGEDLASHLRRKGRLPKDRAVFVARQLCAGLAAAHECRVLHRDLKPSNVMLDERGVARITDFGLAEVGTVVRGVKVREGTPHYMSPEQLAGDEVTVQSDLYALGLTLYEVFTGKRGYSGATLEELTEERRKPLPSPSSLSPEIEPEVERLLLRCLDADPTRRPTSARELLEALPGGDRFSKALAAAQQRADRIAAFRTEMAELRRAGLVQISAEDLETVDRYHDRALKDLVQRFDVDVSERGKQLSLGMRAISFLGAVALAASVYYFFYRIWGAISTPLQIGILAGAPILALFLTAGVARRGQSRYFTSMAGLAAFASLVVNTTMLESIFNLAPSALSVLAWGGFAVILAYGYRIRLLLVIGLAVLAASLAGSLHGLAGGHWPNYLEKPETLFPAALVLLALALLTERRQPAGFAPVYSLLATIFLVAPALFVALAWSRSYLPVASHSAEVAYQLLGFAMSAGAIWLGIARRWKEVVYSGTFFFAAFLFLKFVHWWWNWMPKYLFFLIVALTALAGMLLLTRLRAGLTAKLQETGS